MYTKTIEGMTTVPGAQNTWPLEKTRLIVIDDGNEMIRFAVRYSSFLLGKIPENNISICMTIPEAEKTIRALTPGYLNIIFFDGTMPGHQTNAGAYLIPLVPINVINSTVFIFNSSEEDKSREMDKTLTRHAQEVKQTPLHSLHLNKSWDQFLAHVSPIKEYIQRQ
jgi:hypothetical protein